MQVSVRRILHRRVHFVGVLDDDDTRHHVLSAPAEGRLEFVAENYEGADFKVGEPYARLISPTLLGAIREYLGLHQPGGPMMGGQGLKTGAYLRLRQFGLTTNQIAALPETFAENPVSVDLLTQDGGTVIKRLTYPGKYVKEGEPLFELGDFTTLWLKFDAYERDISSVQVGQAVQFTVAGFPGLRFTNSIVFVDPNIDPLNRSTKVRALVPNPVIPEIGRRRFSHRASAEVDLTLEFPPTLTVPRTAVLNPGGIPRVFVERAPGRYEGRIVRLGQRGDDDWEILEGVSEGEKVVTQGGLLLDGQSQLNGVAPLPLSSAVGSSVGFDGPGLILAADRARGALAADDLAGYREAVTTMAGLPPPTPETPLSRQVLEVLPGTEPADLEAARREFLPFSEALVAWGEALRRSDPNCARLKLYLCPMGKGIFPGAPAQARWVQLDGPIGNPWYGPRMIDCGSEIQP